MISPASIDDAAGAAALLGEAFDDRIVTTVGMRYRWESARPEDRMQYWRAQRDGDLVGWAVAGLDAFAPVGTAGFAGIVVHPAHRRRGIGTGLWEIASQHLEDVGVRRILVHGRSDASSMAFARARGFRLEATETTSAVDPRAVGPPPPPGDGVELVRMSEYAVDPEMVYAADRECALDEPGPADFSGMTYDSWRRLIWDFPDCDHELSAVARVGGVVVGTSFLYSDRATTRAGNAGTGVIRDFRGRGLGLLMKRHSLAWAAAAGITKVITQNDVTNAPMLAINAALGYEPLSVGHTWALDR